MQIDCTVVEQTQDRLTLMRNVESKVQEKVQEVILPVIQVKQKYYEKSMEMQAEIDVLRDTVDELKKEVGR